MQFKFNEFIKEISKSCSKLDHVRTIYNDDNLCVFDNFGTRYKATDSTHLLGILSYLGADVNSWTYEEPMWSKKDASLSKEKSTSEHKQQHQEEKKAKQFEEKVESESSDKGEKVEPDWKWIESLQNKKYDKEAFDEYAEKEFKIKLNKRNTLENMIADFKSQLKGE